MDNRKDFHLSDVQLAVMRALWERGDATTSLVHERMGKPRGLAYTTVATLLARLEKRGLVRSQLSGRERVFEPLVSETEVKRAMVADLVSSLFRGDSGALVTHLVTDSQFDANDLETVRQLLREHQSDRNAEQDND